jgi:hypothetical protein
MASFFQRQDCATRQTTRALLTVIALVLSSASQAETGASAGDPNAPTGDQASSAGLQPYKASYKTTARGMNITLNRELKRDSNDKWVLTNGGKMLVVGFHEQSVFTVDGDRVVPDSYVYQGTGLINRRREVHFTPGADTIRSLYKKQWYELPYQADTLDRMSQQEQLRLVLINADNPQLDVTLKVADAKRVKDYHLKFIGEEVLQTAVGSVATLRFERVHEDGDRTSEFWVAPAWDYLMVKTLHVEDDKPVEAILTSATIGGKAVTPLAE